MASDLSVIKPRSSREKSYLPLWKQNSDSTPWQALSFAGSEGQSARGSAVAADNHARTMNHIRPRFATGSGRPGYLG